MELLEKITLYDLLGYALPGSMVLYEIVKYDGKSEVSTLGIICFCVFSYVLGITISELTSFLTKCVDKRDEVKKQRWESAGVRKKSVEEALKNAKVIEPSQSIVDYKDIWKYYENMYSDIQIDKDCSRLHNYAAGVLLYKNVALSALICGICEFVNKGVTMNSVIFIIVMLCCSHRWYRIKGRLTIYVLNWYVIKYKNPCN